MPSTPKPNWNVEPAYPGAAVAETLMQRGDELGSIRIQHYGRKVRVGAFLPGVTECLPGDTPKTWPDRDEWLASDDRVGAELSYDQYVKDARDDGWTDYIVR